MNRLRKNCIQLICIWISLFFYEGEGLDGFANWYMVQAQEERDHAMLFLKYLQQNGEKVTLGVVDKPDKELKALMDPLKFGFEHEQYVTSLINDIYAAAYDVSLNDQH